MMIIVWLGFVLGALSAEGTVFQTKAGWSTTLECGTKTYQTSLEWHHKNELIVRYSGKTGQSSKGPAAIKTRSKVKQMTNLEISGVSKEDAGTFTCMADGISNKHTLLVVSVSATSRTAYVGSQVTLTCEVGGLEQDSTVEWMRPDGSAHEGSGTVYLNPASHSDSGTWKCTFSYDNIMYNESLTIDIKDPTTIAPTSFHTQRSKVDKTTCPTCSTGLWHLWWVWVVVGVGCLVVIVLMVLVIVLCKRIRRRKKMRQSLRPKQYCKCNCRTAAAKPQQGRQKGRPSALPLQPLLTE